MMEGWVIAGLALALVGISVATLTGIRDWQARQPIVQTIDWPEPWAAREERGELIARIEAELDAPPPKRHRHDLHCAKCGRFARVVEGMPGVGDCRYHGMTIRASTSTSVTLDLRIVQPSGIISS